ncbi:hypothetical protein DXB77_08045 [Clostridium sp. OM05-9]|jgi:hypothetical protein|uniref:hypothetical protein n=1 Tax=Clostridium sp. OM05-9 TaxID=2293045 RepID=UPI000E4A1937|nr:hypothetical protein [Clostridium sp. OM05-9]RHV11119.1 hypothetical protein DXB77_08045 [Clostridium sp. OM05-9]
MYNQIEGDFFYFICKADNIGSKDSDKAIADWKNAQLQEDKSIELEFVACSGKDKAIRIAGC